MLVFRMIDTEIDYPGVVAACHESLYRFAFSLAGNSDDAAELTQESYLRLLNNGAQIRDRSRLKPWLFTTMYHIFLGWKRRKRRFQHIEITSVENELPPITLEIADEIDGETAIDCALELEERFRVPLLLFYLECLSYREIAEMLDVPTGTVMSRLSRGKALLRERLMVRNYARENPKTFKMRDHDFQKETATI